MRNPTPPTCRPIVKTSVNEISEVNAAPQPSKVKLSLRRGSDQPELRERLQKVLAGSGLGARRGIEDRIAAGEVLLNGEKAEVGASVGAGDRVLVDGRTFIIKAQEGDYGRVIVYSKPDGEVTTRHDQEGRPTVFDRLPPVQTGRWIVMGDLDINTQGLLLFTSNGELANKIMTSEESFAREYVCRIKGAVTDEILAQLQAGVLIEQGVSAFEEIAKMEHTGNTNEWWRVRIQTGGTKEVKALWEAVGLQLSRLKRISFGPFRLLPGMRRCDVRELPESDVLAMCQDFGIMQMPSYLLAEDESAMKLRRNRDSEIGKKIILSAGKAEGYWTGERGYGGANVKAQRVSSEFDVDRNKRDKKARKGVKKLSHKQAQIAIGGDGLLSHALEGGQPGQELRHGPSRNAKHRRGVRPPMRQNPAGIPGNAVQGTNEAGLPHDGQRRGNRQRQAPRQRPQGQTASELIVNASDVTLDISGGDPRHPPRGPQGPKQPREARGPHAGPRLPRGSISDARPARGPKPQQGSRRPEATPGLYEPKARGNSLQDDDNVGNRFSGQPMGDAAAARLLERSAIPTANASRFQRGPKGKPARQFSGPMDHSYEGSQAFNANYGDDDDSGLGNRFNAQDVSQVERPRPDRNGNGNTNANANGHRNNMPPRHGQRPPKPFATPRPAAEPGSQAGLVNAQTPRPEGSRKRRNKNRNRPRNAANGEARLIGHSHNQAPNQANNQAPTQAPVVVQPSAASSNSEAAPAIRAPRPPRPPRQPGPPREAQTPREPSAPREPRAPREPSAPREPRAGREPSAPREPRAAREPSTPREPRAPRAPRVNKLLAAQAGESAGNEFAVPAAKSANRRRKPSPRGPRSEGVSGASNGGAGQSDTA